MNARFLTASVAVALLTACGSDYEPYTTQPLPDGPGGSTTHTVLIEASSAGSAAGTVTGTGLSCSISGTSQSSDCTETFATGTEVTLTATPGPGSLFLGWGDACAGSGTNSTCTVLVDRQLRVQAGFGPISSYDVTVSAGAASTGDGTVTAAGINCVIDGAAASQDCSEPHVQGTSLTFTATPIGGSTFLGWGDACAPSGSSTTCTLTVSQEVRVSASFAAPPSHTVTVTADAGSTGNGSVTAAGISCVLAGSSVSQDCNEAYVQGSTITLTATPTGANTFQQWGGACASAGSNPNCSLTVTQPLTVTARFAPPPTHTVTVDAGAASTGNGTVSATGINCVIAATSASQDCSETYVQGSTITLTATPTGNSEFMQWGGACASAGTSATCTLTVTQAFIVSASFAAGIAPPPPTHLLTVQASASGTASGSVTASGISCSVNGASQTGDCSESFNEGTSVTLTATPAGSNTFLGWGGACTGTSSTCMVTMSQARTVTAGFAPPPSHLLTVQAAASGTANGSVTASGISCSITAATQSGDCNESFVENTSVVLTATPAGSNTFLGWGGACTGTSSTCTVTMSQARTVTAGFAPPPRHLLTVQAAASGTANGSVTASGISCSITGSTQSGDCSESFNEGTVVTLTATPAGSNTFLGWGGACTGANSTCTVTMNQARTVTAGFAPPPSHLLTVQAASASTGTGTVTATGINCALSGSSQADDCSESFVEGTSVTLTATATGGSTFAGWGGACVAAGTTTTCTVSMTQALTVTASFTAPPPPNLAGFWSGTDDGGHVHYHATIVQSGNTLSLQPSCPAGDCRLIALTGAGNTWIGGPFADITALSGTVTGTAVTFTMTAGTAGTVTFTGTLTSPNQMRGEVSSPTMPKQNLTLDKP